MGMFWKGLKHDLMIIVRIKCGLGNQLFQYAAAYALSRRLKQPLQLECLPADQRPYRLDQLNVIAETIKNPEQIPWGIGVINNKYVKRVMRVLHLQYCRLWNVAFLWETYDRFIKEFFTVNGTKLLKAIFPESDKVFDYPKSFELISAVIAALTNSNDIVLDSFAGSGTTAHAVLSLNQKDNGNRKFILVEMMDYADSITAERVKRVICGYGEGDKAVPGTGGSFTYYELGETLFDEDGNLNAHVPAEKIREYVWYMETKLPLPILAVENADANDNGAFLGVCNHTAYYFHYDVGGATTLDHDFLASVKTVAESYVIYADACAVSEEFLTKHRITFKKIPRDIERL